MGHGAKIPGARSRRGLRPCREATPSCAGYSGLTNGPAVAWQNVYVERLIGSVRRECLDHVIVFGEAHLHWIMSLYTSYYKHTSQHPSVYVIEENRLC